MRGEVTVKDILTSRNTLHWHSHILLQASFFAALSLLSSADILHNSGKYEKFFCLGKLSVIFNIVNPNYWTMWVRYDPR